MKAPFVKLLGMVCGVLLAASAVAPAPAANINTNANACQTQLGPDDDIVHTDKGIATASTLNTERWISCGVLRSPITTNATTGSFYIDGDTQAGANTICVLVSNDYTGTFLGSASFVSYGGTAGGAYDIFLSMPREQLGYWAYTSMTCVLPAHGLGTLRGVTSMQ